MRKKSGIFLTIFGSVFLGVGLVIGYFSVRKVEEAEAMRSWDECKAQLIRCELSSHRGSKGGTTYKVVAAYKYSINGVEYTGERVGLSSGSDNIGSFHQDQYRRLRAAQKKGKPVSCWVNPRNPAESILVRKPRPPLIVFKMLFVLIFGAVGLCICSSGVFSLLTPDTSSDDFMQHRIRMRGAQLHKSAVGVAVLWNLFAVWMLYRLVGIFSVSDMPVYLWVAGFSGIVPVVIALYFVLRINKYGVSFFELSPVPGVLGGPVKGNIRIPKHVQADDGFDLVLQCIHQYTTRSGKNSTTHKDVLWDSNDHIEKIYNYGSEVVVPVNFHTPYNMPPTSAPGRRNGHYWQLKVKAKTPGIDYNAVFDVPVKRTAQSDAELSSENMPEKPAQDKKQNFEQLVQSLGLDYKLLGDGSITIDFHACRAMSATLFLGVFVVIWTGACWLMAGKAPWFFVAFFIFFDVALVWSFLMLLCVSVRLVICKAKRKISIEKRFISILFKKRDISFNEMDLFEYERGMQSGSTLYYRVVANLIGGKRVKVGGAINSRVCAKRIADELNKLLNENTHVGTMKGSLEDLYEPDRYQ